MTTEIVNSYHQTAVPVCIRLCCRSAEAKKEEMKKKKSPVCRHLPRAQRSEIYPLRVREHARSRSWNNTSPRAERNKKKEKKEKVLVEQAETTADICGRKGGGSIYHVSRILCRGNTPLYYSSDVRVPSLSLFLSLFYLCACPPACGPLQRIARKCHWLVLVASNWRLATPRKNNNQSHQSATARSPHRPQPARNPPLLPSPSPWAPGTVPCSTAETNIRIVMPLSVTHPRERKTPAHREQKWKTKRGRQRKFLHFCVISAPNFKLQQTSKRHSAADSKEFLLKIKSSKAMRTFLRFSLQLNHKTRCCKIC